MLRKETNRQILIFPIKRRFLCKTALSELIREFFGVTQILFLKQKTKCEGFEKPGREETPFADRSAFFNRSGGATDLVIHEIAFHRNSETGFKGPSKIVIAEAEGLADEKNAFLSIPEIPGGIVSFHFVFHPGY